MRPLLLTIQYPPAVGGVAQSTARLASALREAGHEALVLAPAVERESRGFGRPRTEQRDGIPVHLLPQGDWPSGRGQSFALAAARDFAPDVVAVHFPIHAGALGAWLARSLGLPLVVSLRGADVTEGIVRYPYTLRRALGAAAHVTTVSRHLLDWARLVAPCPRASVVWNGIEPGFGEPLPSRAEAREALGLDPRALVLASHAVFRWKKGPEYLVELLAALARSDLPAFEVLLLGDFEAALATQLEAALRPGGGSRSVPALRRVPRPQRAALPAVLAACDLFVSTSRYEGLPNTLLEAMACGVPVAATAVHGCLDLLEDGVGGVLLDAFDPARGAEDVVTLLRDRGALERMGRQARAKVRERYSAAAERERHLEAWRAAIRHHQLQHS